MNLSLIDGEKDGKICDEGKFLTYDQMLLLSAN
jgi:hypothetical protein